MRRWIALLTVAALAFPFGAAPARAQTEPQGVNLSLAEALRIALANNLDLVIARKNPQIAELGIEQSLGIFDPTIGAELSYIDNESDGVQTVTDQAGTLESTFEAGSTTERVSGSWAHLLHFGGRYSVTVGAESFEQDPQRFANFGFSGVDESNNDSQDVTLRYSMPLLRGFGREVNEVDVLLARSGLDISRNDLQLQAIVTANVVENAYWDLVAVRAAHDVAKQTLKLAEDLLDLNKKKVEVGTLAPIEITQAEAGVAAREEAVIVAENAVEAAEDRLLQLLAVPEDSTQWDMPIIPTDRPASVASGADLDAVLAKAMELRPEILSARQNVKDSELVERVADNGTKHGLDLVTAVGLGTVDSEARTSIDGVLIPQSASSSVDSGPNWSVGLVYSYPIGNRTAKASAKSATLNREKSELALQNVEQSIRVDVRNAVRNVESGIKRVKAAEASTVLQKKKLEAEQKKFDNGMSTSFEVLTFQTDLADAQVSEIRAKLDLVKSRADLERAQGTLLEARGLKLE